MASLPTWTSVSSDEAPTLIRPTGSPAEIRGMRAIECRPSSLRMTGISPSATARRGAGTSEASANCRSSSSRASLPVTNTGEPVSTASRWESQRSSRMATVFGSDAPRSFSICFAIFGCILTPCSIRCVRVSSRRYNQAPWLERLPFVPRNISRAMVGRSSPRLADSFSVLRSIRSSVRHLSPSSAHRRSVTSTPVPITYLTDPSGFGMAVLDHAIWRFRPSFVTQQFS